ncbi:hypothetical protein HYH02_005478 [Chlamydomonas schloesseri]|uniref:Uncharacterized protein n=1 Tax=Chlamydomonas schloesseri TaxID=2026947 RepID=A0A835WKF1_9CHLO|nr:hypothetical protein HYH02_005478 [Chlamydomonas schloesseri]|eukprot:KAG2449323.1 hypothetical protein HYH02_005478 [Chlamydomonas schloesseri]
MLAVEPVAVPRNDVLAAAARSESASARKKTRTLLEKVAKEYERISRKRMNDDARSDELTALVLLRSVLTDLEKCILEHEQPPPALSQKRALIKVEKARKEVLAAVKECSGRVSECQKLLDEVELFTELRPNEPVTPRTFKVEWRRPPPREALRRKDLARSRAGKGPGDSLVASIVGLAALAESLDGGETPTSDAAGPASFAPMSPPMAQLKAKQQGQQAAAGVAAVKDAKERVAPPDEVSLLGSVGTVVAASAAKAAAVAAGAAAGAAPCNSSASGVRGPAQQAVARPSGEYGMRLQSDGENDLRPALSTGVADSSATMCNLDSCASGPNQRSLASAAAGGERSYEEGDDSQDEDEVSSADNGRYANSARASQERVVLLSSKPMSLLHTPQQPLQPHPPHVPGSRSARPSPLKSSAPAPRTGALALQPHSARSQACAASQPFAPVPAVQALNSSSEMLVGAPQPVEEAAPAPVGTAAQVQQRSSQALEVALRSQEAILGNRSYVGKEPRHRPVGPTTATVLLQQRTAMAAEQQQLQQPYPQMQQPVAAPPPHAYGVTLSDADAARLRAAVAQQLPPAPRYSVQRHQAQIQPPAAPSAVPVMMQPQQQVAAPMPPQPQQQQQYMHQYVPQQQGPHQQYPAMYSASGAHMAMPPPGAALAAPASAAARPASLPSGPLQVQHSGDVVVGAAGAAGAAGAVPRQYHAHPSHYGGSQPVSSGQSLENMPPPGGSGAFPPHLTHPYHQYYHPSYPASQVAWDSVSLAETEPLPGADSRRKGRRAGRRRGGGLFGFVKGVVGFVGVSVLSGAAMVLGAAAVNTSLDEQDAANAPRPRPAGTGSRRGQRLARGPDDLIPQRTLQQLRSPDLLAMSRG